MQPSDLHGFFYVGTRRVAFFPRFAMKAAARHPEGWRFRSLSEKESRAAGLCVPHLRHPSTRRGRPPCLPELRPTNSLRTLYSPPITPKTSVALRGDIFGYKSLQNRADTGGCPYSRLQSIRPFTPPFYKCFLEDAKHIKPCIIAAPYQGALNLPFKP